MHGDEVVDADVAFNRTPGGAPQAPRHTRLNHWHSASVNSHDLEQGGRENDHVAKQLAGELIRTTSLAPRTRTLL